MTESRSPDLTEVLAAAARALAAVDAGHNLTRALDAMPLTTAAARGAVIDLTHNALRRRGPLGHLIECLCSRGRPAAPVDQLLQIALTQLHGGRRTPHAVVNAAVAAARRLGAAHAAGMINAVLRRYLREQDALETALAAVTDPAIRHSWPAWWIPRLQAQYPNDWEAILTASDLHPPMALRINRRRTDTDRYVAALGAAGLTARRLNSGALLLERPVGVDRLPGFAEGLVSVQDAGAQLAAGFLDVAAGMRVLDACAAPGGKTAHLLETADISLDAVDADPARLRSVAANLARLGLFAQLATGDAAAPADWWDGRSYDRILADVPCSASGVTRRHPDVRLLRRPGDIAAFAERQAGILNGLWQCLAVGGKLLYVTCSLLEEENGTQIRRFLEHHPDARAALLPGHGTHDLQLLPTHDHDGFYFALLEKY